MTPTFLGISTAAPGNFFKNIDRIGEYLTINVPSVFDLTELQSLAVGTLGRELVDHFAIHQLPPLTSGPRRKQLHDAVHVITGYGIDRSEN